VPETEMNLWKSHGTHKKLVASIMLYQCISIFGIYVSYTDVSKNYMLKCIFHVHKCEISLNSN